MSLSNIICLIMHFVYFIRSQISSVNVANAVVVFLKNNHVLYATYDSLNKDKWKKRKDERDYDVYNDDDSIDSNEADGVPDAAKNDVEKQDESAIEDEFGAKDYRSQMILKPDCMSRPLWVVSLKRFRTSMMES